MVSTVAAVFAERVNATYWLGTVLIVAGILITQYSVPG